VPTLWLPASRFQRTLVVLVVAQLVAYLTLALASAIGADRGIAGTATRAWTPLPQNGLMEPLPSQPTARWRSDTHQLFGAQSNPWYLGVLAAHTDLLVVSAVEQRTFKGPIVGVDPADGTLRWSAPPDLRVNHCALNRSGRLACLDYDSYDQNGYHRIVFLDPATGQVQSTTDVAAPGWPEIQAAGAGFLITSSSYPHEGERDLTLTWYAEDGSRSWTHTPPPNVDHVDLSESSELVSVQDDKRGAQVLDMATGAVRYDAAEDQRAAGKDVSLGIVVNAAGFAVSFRGYGDDANRTVFYNRTGHRTGEMSGWTTLYLDPATEDTRLALANEKEHDLAFVSLADRTILWRKHDYQYDAFSKARAFPPYLLICEDFCDGTPQMVAQADTGAEVGRFTTTVHQDVRSFDGERFIVSGEPEGYSGTEPAVSAIDAHTCTQVWRVKYYENPDDMNVKVIPPFLFRLDAYRPGSPAALSLLAS